MQQPDWQLVQYQQQENIELLNRVLEINKSQTHAQLLILVLHVVDAIQMDTWSASRVKFESQLLPVLAAWEANHME